MASTRAPGEEALLGRARYVGADQVDAAGDRLRQQAVGEPRQEGQDAREFQRKTPEQSETQEDDRQNGAISAEPHA